MVARVSTVPNGISRADVVNGRSVRGSTGWQNFAGLANWLIGRGGILVPAFCVGRVAGGTGALTAGSTITLRFNAYPRYSALRRIWILTGRSGKLAISGTAHMQVRAPSGTGTLL